MTVSILSLRRSLLLRMLNFMFKTRAPVIGLWIVFDPHHFLVQTDVLQFVRDLLCSPGLSSEDQPLLSGRPGPERKRHHVLGSKAAAGSCGESNLQTADSEVSNESAQTGFRGSVLKTVSKQRSSIFCKRITFSVAAFPIAFKNTRQNVYQSPPKLNSTRNSKLYSKLEKMGIAAVTVNR